MRSVSPLHPNSQAERYWTQVEMTSSTKSTKSPFRSNKRAIYLPALQFQHRKWRWSSATHGQMTKPGLASEQGKHCHGLVFSLLSKSERRQLYNRDAGRTEATTPGQTDGLVRHQEVHPATRVVSPTLHTRGGTLDSGSRTDCIVSLLNPSSSLEPLRWIGLGAAE